MPQIQGGTRRPLEGRPGRRQGDHRDLGAGEGVDQRDAAQSLRETLDSPAIGFLVVPARPACSLAGILRRARPPAPERSPDRAHYGFRADQHLYFC